MKPEQIQHIIHLITGEYGYMIVGGFIALLFKETIINLVHGAMFMWGSDFDVDDIVYINGEKKARIVRQTITKTVFYIYENDRKMIIQNKELHKLRCEKSLPQNGGNKL